MPVPLSEAKRALLARRIAEGAAASGGASDAMAGSAAPRSSASFAQRRLWFLDRYQPGSPAYHVPLVLRLTGALDEVALRESLADLVDRHESLRTRFVHENDELVQVVETGVAVDIAHRDLSTMDEAAREVEWGKTVAAHTQPPFDLSAAPLWRATLVRVSDDEHRLFLNLHHIIVDGWSLSVLVNELVRGYAERTGEVPAEEKTPAPRYRDYAQWQRHRLAEPDVAAQLTYWDRKLADAPTTELIPDHPRPPVQGWRGSRLTERLTSELAAEVRATAARTGTTTFMVLLAAFAAVLRRYVGQDDLVLGTPVAGRDHVEHEGLVGMLAMTLVLRADTSGDPTFEQLLDRVRGTVLDAYDNAEAPFELLVERLRPDRDPARHPLFQIAFAMQNLPPFRDLGTPTLRVEVPDMVGEVAKFDLAVMVHDGGDRIDCEFEFSTDLFDRDTVRRLAEHYRDQLRALLANPGTPLSGVPMADRERQAELVGDWSGQDREFPFEPVHRLVAGVARRTPDAVAVRDGDGSLSYAELDRRAGELAARLTGLGCGRDTLVAVCLGRSPEYVVALLAVLKCGAAYVPMDPGYPQDRLGAMLADCAAPVVLTVEDHSGRFSSARTTVICLDRPAPPAAATAQAGLDAAPGDRAYVIFTSGSTGRPKGVEVEHRGLSNLVRWHEHAYRLDGADRCTLVASPGFDASAWELWSALSVGASLAIPRDEVRADPARLVEWLAAERVTVGFLPTSVAEAVLAEPGFPDTSMRLLLTGGDALRHAPPDGARCRLVNHYGPTENTVVGTAGVVRAPQDGGEVPRPPIGTAIDNVRAYVLDRDGEPVPVGVPGELYLGGVAVARGYLGDPARTAARFVPDRFGTRPGGRLYRTGDLVRWLPDGRLDFLGRVDNQIKIRGVRVEPGEIETSLMEHPSVREAVVVARDGEDGQRRLAAFVTLTAGATVPSSDDLRRTLRRRLPGHMVPATFAVLDEIPMTGSRKIDRRALAALRCTELAGRVPAEPPRTPAEAAVAEVWGRLLDIADLGRRDDFFELGGHSFLAVRAQRELAERLGVELGVADLFQHPTVAELAEHLDRLRAGPEAQPAAATAASRRDEYARRRRSSARDGAAARRRGVLSRRRPNGEA